MVEAASSSLVTQTKIGSRKIPDFSLFHKGFLHFRVVETLASLFRVSLDFVPKNEVSTYYTPVLKILQYLFLKFQLMIQYKDEYEALPRRIHRLFCKAPALPWR